MASKINKKYSADVKGVMSIDDGIVTVEVEDMNDPVILADLFKDFADKDVKISISYGEELA